MTRTRSRRSAKSAGTRFETAIATALSEALADDRIERRARNGSKDIECKDCTRIDLPGWTREAQLEAGNDDALVGVVVHKRRGVSDPLRQWVSMTVDDLVSILTGQRSEFDS